MLALALVLLALVAVLVVASFVGSSEEVVVEFLNVTITTSVGGIFVAGFVAGLVALAALYSVRTSMRRIRSRRQEVNELRQRADAAGTPAATTKESRPDDHPADEAVAESRDAGRAEEVDGGSRDERRQRNENPPTTRADADREYPPDTSRS
jgi:uncharacterized membrane protein YciS (DUF1049 family)